MKRSLENKNRKRGENWSLESVAELIKESGMKQKVVALSVGIHLVTLSAYIHGREPLPSEKLAEIKSLLKQVIEIKNKE